MSQSLSRILIHVIFSTKDREPWLDDSLKSRVFPYIAQVGRDSGCEVFRVGGTADHVHIALQLPRTAAVSDLVKKLKITSSVWIKQHSPQKSGFSWQAGYGAFSLGESQLSTLIAYIDRQEEHHRKQGFQEEYRIFLRKYHIEYDERYVWD